MHHGDQPVGPDRPLADRAVGPDHGDRRLFSVAQPEVLPRQHFGLGDAEQATVTVIWPDGAVSEGTVGTNRLITVVHPG